MKEYILSIDVESNGLHGRGFIISAVVIPYNNPTCTQNSITLRCPLKGKINDFVSDEVLPVCIDIKENCKSYKEMLKEFSSFYYIWKDKCDIVCHIPYPVETQIFSDCYAYGYISEFDHPYPIFDPCVLLLKYGSNPTSVDEYFSDNLSTSNSMYTLGHFSHNPYNDAIIAGRVFIDLITK